MCSSSLHWRRERNASFKTNSMFKGSHTVQFCRDFAENRLRAVCTCSWSASVWADETPLCEDPMEKIRMKASDHLREQIEVAPTGRKVDL